MRNLLLILCLSLTSTLFAQHKYSHILTEAIEEKSFTGELLGLFVKGDLSEIESTVESLGGFYKYGYGEIASISIPAEKIPDLAQSPAVRQIAYYPVKSHMLLDSAVTHNCVAEIRAAQSPLDTNFTGKGVIIGVLDNGLDIYNPDFLYPGPDSFTRVLKVWDQKLTSGPNTPVDFPYGQEWDSADINAKNCPHLDVNPGHGTNVTGIAAGNGNLISKYTGMAPEADIVVVAILQNGNFLNNVIDGMKYVFNVGDSLNKPVVINTSLGTYFGSHDGRDFPSVLMENMLDEKAGRVVVAAAGNARQYPLHCRHNVQPDTSFTMFHMANVKGYMHFYGNYNDIKDVYFGIGAEDTATKAYADRTKFMNINTHFDFTSGPVDSRKDSLFTIVGDPIAIITTEASIEDDSLYAFFVTIDTIADTFKKEYFFSTYFTGIGKVDFYNSQVLVGNSNYLTLNEQDSTIYKNFRGYTYINPDFNQNMVSSWTCSEKTITVSNYVNRTQYWNWSKTQTTVGLADTYYPSFSSSRGPTREDKVKPDIAASGETTITTVPFNFLPTLRTNNPDKVDSNGLHARNGGTSMASPVVAGIAALYLQKNPNADYKEVRAAIVGTAKTDTITGTNLPDNTWGYGRICAFNALQAEKGCTDTAAINYSPTAIIDNGTCGYVGVNDNFLTDIIKVYPNPADNAAYIEFNMGGKIDGMISVQLVDAAGKVLRVFHSEYQKNKFRLDRGELPSGIYFVQIYADKKLLGGTKLMLF